MSAPSTLRRTLLTATTSTRLFRPTTITRTFNQFSTPIITRASINNNTPISRPFSSTTANMGKGVHNLRNEEEFNTALKGDSDKLMVLDCFATWCGPCKAIAPKVSGFADEYTDVNFYKIDVDEVPEVAQSLSVRAMPTFLLFKDGKKVGDVVGANPVALEAAIKQHM